ncbi:hypothetical protein D5086_022245 [Populus alba]|uniref:Uncharacterized protein n=1 Tax=Populus alba TaxID=43335 RepID=A0ACC4BF87_POPAL
MREHRAPGISIPIQNSVFFRKGEIGDWANHLTPEMGARLDDIMEKKLKGSGLKLPSKYSHFVIIHVNKQYSL